MLPAPLPPDRCALPHTLIKTVSLTLHGFKRKKLKNKRRTEARLPVLQCHRVVGLIELHSRTATKLAEIGGSL